MRVTLLSARGLALLVLLQALGSAGCPRSAQIPPKPPADAGPADAGPPPDAGPQAIPAAKLTALTDGGTGRASTGSGATDGSASLGSGAADGGVIFDAGELPAGELDLSTPDASIPDWARLTFTAAVQLQDFRARLVAADGQLVPNHSEVWVADGGTRVQFQPVDHWPARGCCRLVVDGQVEKLPTGEGSRFQAFEVDFTVTPDPERPVVKKAVRRRHHHR